VDLTIGASRAIPWPADYDRFIMLDLVADPLQPFLFPILWPIHYSQFCVLFITAGSLCSIPWLTR